VDYAPDFQATDQWVYTHFGLDGSSYIAEINYLKGWLQDQLNWMDTQWLLEAGIDDKPVLAGSGIHVYPNPFTDQIHLSVETVGRSPMQIELWSPQGQLVSLGERTPGGDGQGHLSISLPKLSRGIYLLKVWQQNQPPKVAKVLKN
jgi:hypothetical protein